MRTVTVQEVYAHCDSTGKTEHPPPHDSPPTPTPRAHAQGEGPVFTCCSTICMSLR
jgi:hypothetical protein